METLTDIKVSYAIYPSLLDAYLRFKKKEDDETFNSVFDKINKVKYQRSEQELKGVEFEQCVNAHISRLITGQYILPDGHKDLYETANFKFNTDVVDKIASKLQYCTNKQEYMEAVIESDYGDIKLYGIADFTFPEMIVDLKTTGAYKCNKYKENTQHATYSLIRQTNDSPIKAFKYLVTDFNKVYQETYLPTELLHQKLMFTVFEFISFIEYFKKHITDTKIFGA